MLSDANSGVHIDRAGHSPADELLLHRTDPLVVAGTKQLL